MGSTFFQVDLRGRCYLGLAGLAVLSLLPAIIVGSYESTSGNGVLAPEILNSGEALLAAHQWALVWICAVALCSLIFFDWYRDLPLTFLPLHIVAFGNCLLWLVALFSQLDPPDVHIALQTMVAGEILLILVGVPLQLLAQKKLATGPPGAFAEPASRVLRMCTIAAVVGALLSLGFLIFAAVCVGECPALSDGDTRVPITPARALALIYLVLLTALWLLNVLMHAILAREGFSHSEYIPVRTLRDGVLVLASFGAALLLILAFEFDSGRAVDAFVIVVPCADLVLLIWLVCVAEVSRRRLASSLPSASELAMDAVAAAAPVENVSAPERYEAWEVEAPPSGAGDAARSAPSSGRASARELSVHSSARDLSAAGRDAAVAVPQSASGRGLGRASPPRGSSSRSALQLDSIAVSAPPPVVTVEQPSEPDEEPPEIGRFLRESHTLSVAAVAAAGDRSPSRESGGSPRGGSSAHDDRPTSSDAHESDSTQQRPSGGSTPITYSPTTSSGVSVRELRSMRGDLEPVTLDGSDHRGPAIPSRPPPATSSRNLAAPGQLLAVLDNISILDGGYGSMLKDRQEERQRSLAASPERSAIASGVSSLEYRGQGVQPLVMPPRDNSVDGYVSMKSMEQQEEDRRRRGKVSGSSSFEQGTIPDEASRPREPEETDAGSVRRLRLLEEKKRQLLSGRTLNEPGLSLAHSAPPESPRPPPVPATSPPATPRRQGPSKSYSPPQSPRVAVPSVAAAAVLPSPRGPRPTRSHSPPASPRVHVESAAGDTGPTNKPRKLDVSHKPPPPVPTLAVAPEPERAVSASGPGRPVRGPADSRQWPQSDYVLIPADNDHGRSAVAAAGSSASIQRPAAATTAAASSVPPARPANVGTELYVNLAQLNNAAEPQSLSPLSSSTGAMQLGRAVSHRELKPSGSSGRGSIRAVSEAQLRPNGQQSSSSLSPTHGRQRASDRVLVESLSATGAAFASGADAPGAPADSPPALPRQGVLAAYAEGRQGRPGSGAGSRLALSSLADRPSSALSLSGAPRPHPPVPGGGSAASLAAPKRASSNAKDWFYPGLSRQDAETKLSYQTVSCFLVRSSDDGKLVLSRFLIGRGFRHDPIGNPEGSLSYVIEGSDDKTAYESLRDLVARSPLLDGLAALGELQPAEADASGSEETETTERDQAASSEPEEEEQPVDTVRHRKRQAFATDSNEPVADDDLREQIRLALEAGQASLPALSRNRAPDPPPSFSPRSRGNTVVSAPLHEPPPSNPSAVPDSLAREPVAAGRGASTANLQSQAAGGKEAWFLNSSSRPYSEQVLFSKGVSCFLVRPSSQAPKMALSLCTRKPSGPPVFVHFIINEVVPGRFLIEKSEDNNTYPSIETIIQSSPVVEGHMPFGLC